MATSNFLSLCPDIYTIFFSNQCEHLTITSNLQHQSKWPITNDCHTKCALIYLKYYTDLLLTTSINSYICISINGVLLQNGNFKIQWEIPLKLRLVWRRGPTSFKAQNVNRCKQFAISNKFSSGKNSHFVQRLFAAWNWKKKQTEARVRYD